MITQNGLNLFKVLLTNSCMDQSEFTNVEGHTNYVTYIEATPTYWNHSTNYYNGSEGVLFSGSYSAGRNLVQPYSRYRTNQFNMGGTSFWNATTTFGSVHTNYYPEGTSVITIPAATEQGKTTILTRVSLPLVWFNNALCEKTGTMSASMYAINTLGIYGTAPSNAEYFTISYPRCFVSSNCLDVEGAFGAYYFKVFANLGYSNNTESVDDYDLSSPVYNKKLIPTTIIVRCSDRKIEFTIAFKNFESESISVNELGLYNYADDQLVDINNKISFNGYKLGSSETNYYYSYITLYDEVYLKRGYRPNLIVRKVLPQTVTIPPEGVATFKYTIDLSEMKAQENIAYEQA